MKLEIKICGLTSAADACAAQEAGADWLGFVLYAGSPRGISPLALRDILKNLGDPVKSVGVFVNAQPTWVREVALQCGLTAVQLHGDEVESEYSNMPVPTWRAVSFNGNDWHPSPQEWMTANRVVVDAAAPGQYGGSGMTADWERAATLARQRPVILAGGLRPENVADAVRQVRPLGIDVSSGVEIRPGVKSHPAIRAFITAARQAAANLPSEP